MKKLTAILISAIITLSACLPAFAEATTAPAITQADYSGATAASARELARRGEDPRAVLRAAAGATFGAESNDSDVGIYDRVIAANGRGYTAAEFIYYFTAVYFSYFQRAYTYDSSYGTGYAASMFGFDYTQSPDEQYTTDADGNRITFSELFADTAIEAMEQYSYFAMLAKQTGLTLGEDQLSVINSTFETVKASADEYSMTPDEFLETQYGKGVNTYVLMTVMKEQLLSDRYSEYLTENTASQITDDEITARYDEDPVEYQTITARIFRFGITYSEDGTSTDSEEVQKKADEFIAKVTDEKSFVRLAAKTDPEAFSEESDNTYAPDLKYNEISRGIGENAADWTFSSARKPGDISSFATTSSVYIIYIVSPAKIIDDCLPSVRHILVTYSEEAEEDGVTDYYGNELVTKEKAFELANSYLDEYNRGDKTEESFAALAEKYSEDTASTSAGNQGSEGGLYTDIEKGQYVSQFQDWAYAEERQPGDVGIIESRYGYHVMYFVGRADEPVWKATIRAALADEKTKEKLSEYKSIYAGTAVYDEDALKSVRDKTVAFISDIL